MCAAVRCRQSVRNAMRLISLVGFLFVLPFSTSAQALGSFLVMDSVGLPLKPGQEIDLTRPMTLKPGEKLSLVGYNGFILTFVGPTTVTANSVANPFGGKFLDPLRALVDRLQKSDSLRSVRSTGRRIEDPWHIDVTRPGSRCILEQAPITVWRDTPSDKQTLVIGPSGASWFASMDWPSDSDLMALGGEVRFDNGERVMAELDGVISELTINVIPRSVTSPAAQAAWMIEKGCEEQAVIIVRGLIGN